MKTSLLLPLLLTLSCGETRPLRFSGKGFADEESGLAVIPRKEKGVIVATHASHGFYLPLPYAEDWVFSPTSQKPLHGLSESLQMAVSIQTYRPGRGIDEEAYLSETLKKSKAQAEKNNLPVLEDAVSKVEGGHLVLQYALEVRGPQGTFRNRHFWSVRQQEEGTVYDVHLSTALQDGDVEADVPKALRHLVGFEFRLLPKGK